MRGNVSSKNIRKSENLGFAGRFAEACGTSEPARIQRLLNISYQAAKNYLAGRLPDTRVLMRIAEKTPYSLHWLLTGTGEKLAGDASLGTLVPAHRIRAMIREECAEAVSEILETKGDPRIVVLPPDKIRSEKINTPEHSPEYEDRTRNS